MNALLIKIPRMASRSAPACLLVAAAGLSIGAYSGYAHLARSADRSHGFTLRLSAKQVRISPGSSRRITVTVRRRHLAGPIRLRVTSKLPRGLTVRVAPAKLRGKRSVLTLRSTKRLRDGRYVLRITAVRGRKRRTAKLILTVGPPRGGSNSISGGGASTAQVTDSFSISGDAGAALQPGVAQPIDLQIHNPNSASLTLSSLDVVVSAVQAPQATSALPCTTADFSVAQYSGLLPLVVAPQSTVTLDQLGVPQAEWPAIAMVDRPTNQDGCQKASLSLSYHATASLG